MVRKIDPLRENLKTFCESYQVDYVELNLDMPVRWNSTFKMIQVALRLKKPLDALMRNSLKLSNFILEDAEWKLVEDMAKYLRPFSKMTDKISVQNIPTLSLTALIYVELYGHIESYKGMKGVHADVKTSAQKAKDKLDEYYDTTDSLVYVVATVLDPRCKLNWYSLVGYSHLTSKSMKMVTEHWENFY